MRVGVDALTRNRRPRSHSAVTLTTSGTRILRTTTGTTIMDVAVDPLAVPADDNDTGMRAITFS